VPESIILLGAEKVTGGHHGRTLDEFKAGLIQRQVGIIASILNAKGWYRPLGESFTLFFAIFDGIKESLKCLLTGHGQSWKCFLTIL
jgi:hypothetical protein